MISPANSPYQCNCKIKVELFCVHKEATIMNLIEDRVVSFFSLICWITPLNIFAALSPGWSGDHLALSLAAGRLTVLHSLRFTTSRNIKTGRGKGEHVCNELPFFVPSVVISFWVRNVFFYVTPLLSLFSCGLSEFNTSWLLYISELKLSLLNTEVYFSVIISTDSNVSASCCWNQLKLGSSALTSPELRAKITTFLYL